MRRPGLDTRFRLVRTRSRPRPYLSWIVSTSNDSPGSTLKSVVYPSSLSRRAISTFSFEAVIVVVSCSALLALRMRVSMSATGSVSTVVLLPRALRHAGNDALVGELPQADAAEPELLVDGARAAAAVAAAVLPRRVLLRPGGLDHEGLLGH